MAADIGLATLLDLNDSIIAQEHGCWVKIEAWRCRKAMKYRMASATV